MFVSGERMQKSVCDQCKQERVLVVTNTCCQIAWCVACSKQIHMATRSEEQSAISFMRLDIIRWLSFGKQFLIQTTETLIFVNLDGRTAEGF
jgi:hypothetical protein